MLRSLILLGGGFFLCWTATLSLDWRRQAVLAGLTLLVALCVDRTSKSYLVTLTLILLSVYSTLRYGVWRLSTVARHFRDPGAGWTSLEAFFIGLLLLAECYSFTILLLGYLQTLWPLDRSPAPLPDDPDQWPAVDLLIPTYHEPLSMVRFTVLAAMNIDWPADRLNIYLLDDGRREEFRTFAKEAGVGYIARDGNRHAKAGNINYALDHIHAPFVAVFDCDHVPTRSFLQLTMGWFVRDPKLAMLQTPQHFYSPGPFERNLDQFRIIPNEDDFFYGVVQDGNDFWNAALFCGSCAVLRRRALDQVGGIAVQTLTEDAHTCLRLQIRGWNTAYLNIPQAAGLASDRLSGHVRQRIRWACGMVQILRLENPLFAPGLKLAQRLCYFAAMLHFLCALPRLIFLTAPIVYLIFGIHNLPGFWAAILAYAIPHLVLADLAHSRIQGRHRHSFWNEIYETVLAPYILLPTLFTLIRPKSARSNVTAKGGVVEHGYFDTRTAWPFLMLGAINFLGLLCALPRLLRIPVIATDGWPSGWASLVNWPASLYDPGQAETVWVYVSWTLFNLAILGVATAVAWESQQRRQAVRIARSVPSDVILPDGSMIQGITSDLSSSGVRTRIDRDIAASAGQSIQFVFPVLDGSATLPATIIAVDGREVRARFDSLTLQQDEALAMILYSRADAWIGLGERGGRDGPVRSMVRILRLSLRGVRQLFGPTRAAGSNPKDRMATSVVPLIAAVLLAGLSSPSAGGAGPVRSALISAASAPIASLPATLGASGARATDSVTAAELHTVFTLADAGVSAPISLSRYDASRAVAFSIPRNEVVKTAVLRLNYHLSPELVAGVSHLDVSLNGTLVSTITAGTETDSGIPASTGSAGSAGTTRETAVTLPVGLLAEDNLLTFDFIGRSATGCQDTADSALWARIDRTSSIEIAGSLLPPGSDLKVLPLPFYERGMEQHPKVQLVFLATPSAKAIQAAGVVASWFGVLNGERPVRFPVSIGKIPSGNAIVIAEDAAAIPASLGGSPGPGATVAMIANPADPNSNLLLVAGGNANRLLAAAKALTLHGNTWHGARASIRAFEPPAPRRADDAPDWLRTDGNAAMARLPVDVERDGSIDFRLPPDLFYGERQNLGFHLSYRYNGVPLGADSTLQVYVNGTFVGATPLPHKDNTSTVLETILPVPVVDLRPFSNTIRFRFAFRAAQNAECPDAGSGDFAGTVLKDSFLDITGLSHAASLPNLELFANAGYPFTRSADLGETTVVLPDRPSAAELEMFLALMAHIGAETGLPALRVAVTHADGMTRQGTTDYLLLGTALDQPALRFLSGSLPALVSEDSLKIVGTESLFNPAAWWNRRGAPAGQSSLLETEGGLPDGVIEEAEWPARSNRTVVAIVVRDDAAIEDFVSAFLAKSQTAEISQSVSVLDGDRFTSYRVGRDVYRVGQISWMERLSSMLEDAPWLIAVIAVIFCFLLAALTQAILRRRARERLQVEGE